MEIKQLFISGANRLNKKMAGQRGVVVHWTANLGYGAGALGHRGYVGRQGQRNAQGVMCELNGSPFNYGAAHFYVDDKDIVQYIPTDEVAPHVGANTYTSLAQALFGNYPNGYLLGIETCVNPDSNFDVALDKVANLAASLLKERGLNVDSLYRHYDITGKECPAMMISENVWGRYNASHLHYVGWQSFKNRVQSIIDGKPVELKPQPQPATPEYTPVDSSVLSIQRKLNLLKIKDSNGRALVEDGISGPATISAIKKFQEVAGLDADGKFGPRTESAYQAIVAKPLLKRGANGIAVRYLQYKIGAGIDGSFGPGTESSAKKYQASKGLVADGIVGNQTWGMLFRY